MEIIFKQAWILLMAVTIANALTLKFRSKKYIAQNPALEEGYKKIFKGFIIFGNIPWIIVAFGNLTGLTNSIFDFFNPGALNPVVLIFHASIIVLWVLSVW
jgi:hypothetical protein